MEEHNEKRKLMKKTFLKSVRILLLCAIVILEQKRGKLYLIKTLYVNFLFPCFHAFLVIWSCFVMLSCTPVC